MIQGTLLGADELTAFLCERFHVDRGQITGDARLFSSSLLDSVNMVELIEFLEVKTGLVFEAGDLSLDNFDTVALIVSYCKRRSR